MQIRPIYSSTGSCCNVWKLVLKARISACDSLLRASSCRDAHASANDQDWISIMLIRSPRSSISVHQIHAPQLSRVQLHPTCDVPAELPHHAHRPAVLGIGQHSGESSGSHSQHSHTSLYQLSFLLQPCCLYELVIYFLGVAFVVLLHHIKDVALQHYKRDYNSNRGALTPHSVRASQVDGVDLTSTPPNFLSPHIDICKMLEFRTQGYNGYAVKYSPFFDSRIAVSASLNFGLVGNGRLYILNLTERGIVAEQMYILLPY